MRRIPNRIRLRRQQLPHLLCTLLLACMLTPHLFALSIPGYSASVNDRFSSGYPSAPVPNTNSQFIGLDYDWSGVGWSSTASTRSYGFISPQHYLVARHFSSATSVTVQNQPGELDTASVSSIGNTNYGVILPNQTVGDLSLGTLAEPLGSIARNPILDLNDSSTGNTPANYTGRPLLVYGRGPTNGSTRIGAGSINGLLVSGLNHYFMTSRTQFELETGDSGSPLFVDWTNPNGETQLAIVGNHAAISDTYNFHNFACTLEVMAALNSFMTPHGRALWVVGEPLHTWVGSTSTDIRRNSAWGITGGPPNASGATSDRFVRFNATSAGSLSVAVPADYYLRGIYFQSSATTNDGFGFSGNGVLTIGRGGIVNYDADSQSFTAPLRLGDHQFWQTGAGGLHINQLDTNGYLLEIAGTGTTTFVGNLSGSGAIALDSGVLLLSGQSDYSGITWLHGGSMHLTGTVLNSPTIRIAAAAELRGSGSARALENSGMVMPGIGSTAGILTAESILSNESSHMVFRFGHVGAPDWEQPQSSINAAILLTSPQPFASSSATSQQIHILFDGPAPFAGQRIHGGIATLAQDDFIDQLAAAEFHYYLPAEDGPYVFGELRYEKYSGPYGFGVATVAHDLIYQAESISGRILQFTVLGNGHQLQFTEWLEHFGYQPGHGFPEAEESLYQIQLWAAYALGLDPSSPERSGLPQIEHSTGAEQQSIRIRYQRNLLAADISYTVLASTDLLEWFPAVGQLELINPDLFADQTTELLQFTVQISSAEPIFVRLDMTRNP